MKLKDLILRNRSYRRFIQKARITQKQLSSWIDLARLGASGRNAQTIKYITITDEKMCKKIYPNLAWAGYIQDWDGPEEGERPAAYVVMLNDENLGKNYFSDDGIAVQNLLLGAVNDGYGGCIIRAFKNKELRTLLELAENHKIIQIVALGKPIEEIVLEEMKEGDIKYWRDEKQIHYVPKRKLDEIIINEI
jgi:nitroreductase